jgi:hypothetical protein
MSIIRQFFANAFEIFVLYFKFLILALLIYAITYCYLKLFDINDLSNADIGLKSAIVDSTETTTTTTTTAKHFDL